MEPSSGTVHNLINNSPPSNSSATQGTSSPADSTAESSPNQYESIESRFLQNMSDGLSQMTSELKESLRQKGEELSQISREKEELELSISEKDAELVRINKSVRETITAYKKRIASLEEQVKNANAAQENGNRQILTLNEQVAQQIQQIDQLTNDKNTFREELANLRKNCALLGAALRALSTGSYVEVQQLNMANEGTSSNSATRQESPPPQVQPSSRLSNQVASTSAADITLENDEKGEENAEVEEYEEEKEKEDKEADYEDEVVADEVAVDSEQEADEEEELEMAATINNCIDSLVDERLQSGCVKPLVGCTEDNNWQVTLADLQEAASGDPVAVTRLFDTVFSEEVLRQYSGKSKMPTKRTFNLRGAYQDLLDKFGSTKAESCHDFIQAQTIKREAIKMAEKELNARFRVWYPANNDHQQIPSQQQRPKKRKRVSVVHGNRKNTPKKAKQV